MPGADFKTDYDVMSDKAGELAELADTYGSIAERLRDQATSMGAAFQSADNRTYVSRIEAACDDLAQMAKQLLSHSGKLELQSKKYKGTEDENTGVASQLPG